MCLAVRTEPQERRGAWRLNVFILLMRTFAFLAEEQRKPGSPSPPAASSLLGRAVSLGPHCRLQDTNCTCGSFKPSQGLCALEGQTPTLLLPAHPELGSHLAPSTAPGPPPLRCQGSPYV